MATLTLGRQEVDLSSRTSSRVPAPPSVTSVWVLSRAPVVTPDDLQEAELRWGGPSEFEFSTTNPKDNSDGMTVGVAGGDEDTPTPDPAALLLEFNELFSGRKTHTVTITDDDSSASIDVKRIDQIDFVAPQPVIALFAKAVGVTYSQILCRFKLDWSHEDTG